MAILVTGGAGYIGSHMAIALIERGEEVIVIDNLSTGIRALAPKGSCFVEGDVGDPCGRAGQPTPRARHLIRRACQRPLGRLPYLEIDGVDFETPDGTGVRDYIHVSDLVAAHALALDHLRGGGQSGVFTCGYRR